MTNMSRGCKGCAELMHPQAHLHKAILLKGLHTVGLQAPTGCRGCPRGLSCSMHAWGDYFQPG